MQIISNQTRPVHRQIISQLIEQADEIIICVAFLKSSGLDFIIDKLKSQTGNCTFYIGTDYFLTEPNAIRKLSKQGHLIFRTQKKGITFHPKIYYFKKGNSISILIGSANMTGGGLESNYEVSFLIETNSNSTIDKDFKSIIKIYADNSIDFGDELLISQYENDYEKYKQKHKKADKEFKDEQDKVHKFDLSKLPKLVAKYRADDDTADRFEDRVAKYKSAKRNLDAITNRRINSPSEFLEFYEPIAKNSTGFHSSGLLRGKKKMSKSYRTILKTIKLIQDNRNLEPKKLFEKSLPLVQSAKRFGINALTEIMNTYNPNKFSVANGRTLKSLSDLKFPKYPSPNNFDAATYDGYNNLIRAIANKCKFENLGHVDHFLSWYYDNYVKE